MVAETVKRDFAFIVIFFFAFSFFIAHVPAIIRYAGKSYEDMTVPDEWHYLSWSMNITSSDNGTITRPPIFYNELLLQLDPYDVSIATWWFTTSPDELAFYRRDTNMWLWVFPTYHYEEMEPFPVTKSYAESKLEGNVSRFIMSDDERNYYVQIHYDEGTYGNMTQAWDNGELYVWIGLGWEQLPTTVNAWKVITNLLLFQSVEVHPYIDPFISIGLWVIIAFLVFTLISRIVPFIKGG